MNAVTTNYTFLLALSDDIRLFLYCAPPTQTAPIQTYRWSTITVQIGSFGDFSPAPLWTAAFSVVVVRRQTWSSFKLRPW